MTWVDRSATGLDTDGSAVRARVFSADGSAASSEFLVNMTTTTGNQDEPAIAALDGGGFVIVFKDNHTAGDIRGQVFAANGAPVGTEFVVNTTIAGTQTDAHVTGLTGGGFIVTWTDESGMGTPNFDGSAVRGQRFAANGNPDGEEFLVNAITEGDQSASGMTTLLDGRVFVTWQDESTLTGQLSDSGVRGQFFDPREAALDLSSKSLDDQLVGSRLGDWIHGHGGNDLLWGENGSDVLLGGKGHDVLRGGFGDDILAGGKGRDDLFGNQDSDTFDFNRIKDSTRGAHGRDTIWDFNETDGDVIDLSDIDARPGGADNAFKFIGLQDFHGRKGELRVIDKGTSVLVQADVNGDGKADFAILVKHVAGLDAGDFVL